MVTNMIRIPKLAATADGKFIVTQWGHAASILFRVGDEVIVAPEVNTGLLLMTPSGWGNPMFGRRAQGQLVAEPSGNPASSCRWSVRGAVVAVERDLERGGVSGGRWYCAVRVEALDLTAIAGAREVFSSGWRTASEVDELCRRAAVAPELHGVAVAVACGDSIEQAEAMLESTSPGRLRFTSRPDASVNSNTGIILPGPWRDERDRVSAAPVAAREAYGHSRIAAGGGGHRVQLSLFGDIALGDE